MNSRVTHDSPFGSSAAPAGTEPWAIRWRIDFQSVIRDLEADPRRAGTFVEIGEKWNAWTLLKDANGNRFRSFDAFCEAPRPHGLEYDAKKFRAFLSVAVGKATFAAVVAQPAPTHADAGKKGGRPKKTAEPRQEKARDNDNGLSRGTDPTYLASRIARDAPAVHEEMKAGKYPSVRAAAVAAGIVKKSDPTKVAARAVNAIPVERVAEFVARIDERLLRALRSCISDRLGG